MTDIMPNKEAVAVLAGGIKRGNDGRWQSSDFSGSDCGPVGSITRVLAGKYIYDEDTSRLIIVSGGRGGCERLLDKRLSLSAILKREMVELGVPESSVIEESSGENTYQQLLKIAEIAKNRKLGKILIISSGHHLPRIKAMLEHVPAVSTLRNIVETISSDNIVSQKDPHWTDIIKEAYGKEPILGIIENEKRGVEQIKDGNYKFR